MSRVVVLASPAIADGFRLAGAATHAASPGAEAGRMALALAAEEDVGVVLVTEDLWTSFDDRLRGTLECLSSPIVQAIPVGLVSDATARRAVLGEMLQRAIGYRVDLGGGRPENGTSGGPP